MDRPPLEVADVIRAAGPAFLDHAWMHFDRQQLKALKAIQRCRTAALGGHIDQCSQCGKRVLSYNSCRNRHCPKCQANARHRWLEARRAELLPTRYVHVVFTLPHQLAPLALVNQQVIYKLLFRLSAETMLELARDPRLLGAEIGFFSVLHTWNQKLQHHPHVHCVVPEGGIALDGSHWVRPCYNFFLPVKAMAKAFRGKFLDALQEAFAAGQLRFPGQMKNLATPRAFAALLRQSCRHKWVVYAKHPFGGPEHVLQYLGNYTHRIAISNHRLVEVTNDGNVSFRWRDSAHHNQQRVMTLRAEEFLRRFFLHVLPRRFVRIRHFGFLTNRKRKQSLQLCRTLLEQAGSPLIALAATDTASNFWSCPDCGGVMVLIERLTPAQTYVRPPPVAEVTP